MKKVISMVMGVLLTAGSVFAQKIETEKVIFSNGIAIYTGHTPASGDVITVVNADGDVDWQNRAQVNTAGYLMDFIQLSVTNFSTNLNFVSSMFLSKGKMHSIGTNASTADCSGYLTFRNNPFGTNSAENPFIGRVNLYQVRLGTNIDVGVTNIIATNSTDVSTWIFPKTLIYIDSPEGNSEYVRVTTLEGGTNLVLETAIESFHSATGTINRVIEYQGFKVYDPANAGNFYWSMEFDTNTTLTVTNIIEYTK